jgi:hypothetical protein
MARVFAYLMGNEVEVTDGAIFEDTSLTIRKALRKVRSMSDSKTLIAHRAFEIALKQLL